MIELNGSKFAECDDEFVNSLFTHGGTCNGYAKRLKRQIKLFNVQKGLIGVINKYGVICKANKTVDGIFYNHGTIKEIGEFGRCSRQIDEVKALAKEKVFLGGEYVYAFK